MTRWQNREQVLRRIRRLPETVKTAVRASLAQSADELVAAQQRAAPVRTGTLKRSIIWEWGSAGRKASALEDFTITVHIGPEARYYAHLVEFGAAPHTNEGMFAGSENPGAPPQPFFYPTYRAQKKTIKAHTRAALRKGIRDSKG